MTDDNVSKFTSATHIEKAAINNVKKLRLQFNVGMAV